MHVSTFDRYEDRASFIHGVDPRVKVVATLAFIVSVVLLPDGAWWTYGLAFLVLVAMTLAAHLSPWLVVRRSLVGLPFMLAAVTLLFTVPGAVLWSGPFGLSISDAGLERFASILLRSLLALQAAVLLTASTRFPDILHALRHLHVPSVLVAIIAFMYRYLFVLADEVTRLLRARTARSARLPELDGGGNVLWQANVAGRMAGQLFVRSLDRSERVYNAMLARGYRGEMLTMQSHAMERPDWAFLILALAVAALLQVVARI